MRELRRYGEELLRMSPGELALALIQAMQERTRDPMAGNANRITMEMPDIGRPSTPATYNPQAERKQREDLERALRAAYRLLDDRGLIEPLPGMNGQNGFVRLTEKGLAVRDRLDLDQLKRRADLRQDMLHPALHGKPWQDYANGHAAEAVFEAFKIVEIAVRQAAGYPDTEFGQPMMLKAFAPAGPLALASEAKPRCEALARLFAGAVGCFKNPGSHTKPAYLDVALAIEELMLASRLLRIVDELGRRKKP